MDDLGRVDLALRQKLIVSHAESDDAPVEHHQEPPAKGQPSLPPRRLSLATEWGFALLYLA